MLDAAALRALRADFPPLARLRRGKPPIYFNNTCMTLRPRPVIEAIGSYYAEFPTCGGGRTEGRHRLSNWFQEELREHEEGSREAVRGLLNAASIDEVVWTRNATEALNLVARGWPLAPGDRVLTSEREHNSNLVPWLEVERRLRAEAKDPALHVFETFDLAKDGSFSLPLALEKVRPGVKVVSVGQASNLDGTTIPDADLRALADAVHRVGGILVLDAAQGVPHRKVDVAALGVDFLAFSLHKMCGPSGVGVLWGRHALLERLAPFVVGGDTIRDTWHDRVEYKGPPGRFEAGLQDYGGIVGAGPAVDYVARRVGYDAIEAHERRLNALLTERIAALEDDRFWILGPRDPEKRGGVLTVTSPLGSLVNAIARVADEDANVMMRRGMFCVNAYLHKRHDAAGTSKNNLRMSMYFYNTEDEVERVAGCVAKVIREPMAYLDDE